MLKELKDVLEPHILFSLENSEDVAVIKSAINAIGHSDDELLSIIKIKELLVARGMWDKICPK